MARLTAECAVPGGAGLGLRCDEVEILENSRNIFWEIF